MVPTPVRFALAGVGRFFSPSFAPSLSVFSFNLGQILNPHEPLLLGLDSTECFMSKTEEESVFRRTSFGPTFYSQQLYQSRSKRNLVKPAVFQSSTLRLTFLFFSDSPDLVDLAFLEAFTYRNSSTARALPCLVEATTAHGVHVFFVVILEPSDESSTIKMVIFLTQTLENSRFAPNDQRSTPNNPLTATVSISDHEIRISSRRNQISHQISTTNLSPVNHLKDRPLPPPSTLTPAPPSPARRSMPSTMTPAIPPCPSLPSTRTPASTQHLGGGASYAATTGASLGFCLLGPHQCSGPLRLSRPTDENYNSSTSLSRPRSEFIPSLSPNTNLFCLQGLISRGLCPEATNWIWRSENLSSRTLLLHWKKAQVDSKKILAQPHQSATANPGIFRDILSIAKSFHDLSFRFIPRSDNMLVDDLARTAVRSMTLGHNISLYFCFF